ncbi:MAG: glycosyl transferase family protein [Qingshengfaniella sp.]
MTLADYVRILGRGPSRSRDLTQDEAHAAMTLILSGDAAPEAIGALLMLLRMKGETAAEIAGFAQAARAGVGSLPQVDLDWPSYAAGRTRGLPYFLLAARLVAMAGHRVLLHGWNGPHGAVRDGLAVAGIPVADSIADSQGLLDRHGIAYLPLEGLSPGLVHLLGLRQVLGLRSCVNTVCRMLNPAGARASVQGVFHPSYRLLQADAAEVMGWQALSVIKGGGGEFERHPGKAIIAFGLRDGAGWEATLPPGMDITRRLADGCQPVSALADLWQGRRRDPFDEAIVTGTAALALDTLGTADPETEAAALWARHRRVQAA